MSRSGPLERAFEVLDIVASAGRDVSLVEIVNASGLPQSTTFRLAASLVESGMLRINKDRKTYEIGSRARRLAFFLRGATPLAEIVLPTLEALAMIIGETAFFARNGRSGVKLLRYVVPELGARAFIHPGFDFPAHATAAGKVVHAFTFGTEPPPPQARPAYQDTTVTDTDRLREVYAAVLREGLARNDSELDPGVFSMAAPVFFGDHLAGALALVGPRERMLEIGPDMLKTTERLLTSMAGKLSGLGEAVMRNGT